MPRTRTPPRTEVIHPETKTIREDNRLATTARPLSPEQLALREQRQVLLERQMGYLKAMSEVVTLDEWLAITRKAVDDAKRGNPMARQWLSNYLLGKPVQQRTDKALAGDGGQTTIAILRMSVEDL